MITLASFGFDNADALLPRENIVKTGDGKTVVRLFRRMRTEPLPGMKQPLLNSAVMGLETVLEVLFKGKPAKSYHWKLYRISRKKKFVQRGVTDEFGQSGNVNIGFTTDRYEISILIPRKTIVGTVSINS